MSVRDTVHKYATRQGEVFACGTCEKQIKCKGGNTTGIKRHLKSMHSIDVNNM